MVADSGQPEYATPRSADKMLHILEVLTVGNDGWTLSAICREIETPKSSVLNLMRALVQSGYVDHRDGLYKLSAKSFVLASAMLSRRTYPEAALPSLRRLVEATGETAKISEITTEGDEFVYIAKVESRHSLRFAATVGDRRPLHSTAAGLALLSAMPLAAVQSYLQRATFTPLTSLTKTRRIDVANAIDQARDRGLAITTGESTLGLSAVAAPVIGAGGHLSALVLGAPTERFDARSEEFIEKTVATAREISAMMGQIGDARAL
ncbi:MAG: IclR family transcriptional regulator [Gemmobacter sp.]|nr:IclR family transcriptional regulator [Gemmobacter sp.]